MLEREREKPGFCGQFSSLWQVRHNPSSDQTFWYHVVTQRQTYEEPHEAKGSILADDVCLAQLKLRHLLTSSFFTDGSR